MADGQVFHCAGWDEMSLRLGSGRRQGTGDGKL
jgi:hypothetical protein